MKLQALVQNLADRGIQLSANGKNVVVQPASRLTDADREAIRSHKPELLALLAPKPLVTERQVVASPTENAVTVPEPPPAAAPGHPIPAPAPKLALGDSDPASKALVVLVRLRGYTLPAGRMEAARNIVARLEPLLASPDLDPAAALAALQAIEAELTALGGGYDPELAHAIGLVNGAFPGAPLVEAWKLQ